MTEGGAPAPVLVVTHDEEMRVRLRRLLRSVGHEVDLLGDAEAVSARIASDPPSLVVVDLGLPHRAGWPLLVHESASSPAPPVIALVPRGDYRGLAQAIREGAEACVFQPFHDDDLVGVCQTILQRPAPAAPPVERRLGRRRILIADVSVESLEGTPIGTGEMTDLGTGGAQVRLAGRLEPGTRVRITLPVPVGKPLRFDAAVQWNGRARGGFAHGLQFVDLTLALRRQLGDLLEARPA
jgi:FixJ family two-component response regulator